MINKKIYYSPIIPLTYAQLIEMDFWLPLKLYNIFLLVKPNYIWLNVRIELQKIGQHDSCHPYTKLSAQPAPND